MLGGEVSVMFEPNVKHHINGSQEIRLTSYQRATDVPMEDARKLLAAHLTWAYDKFRALGAPDLDLMVHSERFFEHFSDMLPPNGAYFLAHTQDDTAVGTGALRRVSEEVAEMKHLYVQPQARGTGLGRALIEARIQAARELGIKTLVADTFQGNEPMIRLYRRIGFKDSAPYDSAVATISPELVPFLKYFQMEL